MLALTIISGAIVSCKKDKKSKSELLTEKTWKVTKEESKMNSSPYVDDFPGWASCEKDNIIQFFTNNTFKETEGATKCDPADPDEVSAGGWAFTQNETKITLNGLFEATIEQLDGSTLVVTYTETSGSDTYSTRTTYSH